MKASQEKKLLYQGCRQQNFLKGNQQSTTKLCRERKYTHFITYCGKSINVNKRFVQPEYRMQLESFI